MTFRRYRLWAALLLFILSLALLIFVLLPGSRESQSVPLQPPVSQPEIMTPQPGGPAPQPGIGEHRQIVLEWPERMLEKEGERILLSLVVDESGLTNSATPGQAAEQTPVDIPNIYDTHNLVAAARLDIAGLESWRDEIREPMRPGVPVNFQWSIRAEESGRYRGIVWLWLDIVPKEGGLTERLTLLSRPIEIEAVTILGLSGQAARWVSGVGLVLSTVFGFPFLENLIKLLWSKIHKEAHLK